MIKEIVFWVTAGFSVQIYLQCMAQKRGKVFQKTEKFSPRIFMELSQWPSDLVTLESAVGLHKP